jgi:hypothetical protein
MTLMPDPDARDDDDEALGRRYADQAGALGEWAGVPLPVSRAYLVMEPRYPFTGIETSRGFLSFQPPAPQPGVATGDEDRVYNRWYSRRLGRVVSIRGDDTRRRAVIEPRPEEHRLDMAFTTMKVAGGWSPRAERRAREKLLTLISPGHARSYELTGGFLERSPRSGVVYLFRKLRPTVALRHVAAEDRIRVLAALCLHPVGYYEGSWAGAMTPTDDVIAHLLMMRGCEPRFWARAVQHPIWDPAGGI